MVFFAQKDDVGLHGFEVAELRQPPPFLETEGVEQADAGVVVAEDDGDDVFDEESFTSNYVVNFGIGVVCINQNEEWFVATHFMDKRSLLFEELPQRESCTQETIDHLLQVIDSDFKVCKEVA